MIIIHSKKLGIILFYNNNILMYNGYTYSNGNEVLLLLILLIRHVLLEDTNLFENNSITIFDILFIFTFLWSNMFYVFIFYET